MSSSGWFSAPIGPLAFPKRLGWVKHAAAAVYKLTSLPTFLLLFPLTFSLLPLQALSLCIFYGSAFFQPCHSEATMFCLDAEVLLLLWCWYLQQILLLCTFPFYHFSKSPLILLCFLFLSMFHTYGSPILGLQPILWISPEVASKLSHLMYSIFASFT